MDRFGPQWVNHPNKILQAWNERVSSDDIVLVPGDISWAKKLSQAQADLNWLSDLPGQKILLRGNHDYWWESLTKMRQALGTRLHAIQNNAIVINNVVFFGSRLWDSTEYSVEEIIDWDPAKGRMPVAKSKQEILDQEERYNRELQRLKLSIENIPTGFTGPRIALCHYPPLGNQLKPTRASKLLEAAGASHVVFGHLHSIKEELRGKLFGEARGVKYHLASCDYIDFKPILVAELC